MITDINEFFNQANKWQKEFQKLRKIVLDSQLDEELKWGKPTYSLGGKNMV